MFDYHQQKQAEDVRDGALYSRWKSLQKQQQEINNRWNQKISEFKSSSEAQFSKLEETQNKEVEEFILKWKDPNFLRQFNKPSTRLLQIREQERAMAVSRMYQQAKEMKAIGDKIQSEETNASQIRMSSQMALERKRLSEKHEKEKHKLIVHRDTSLRNMELEKKKELRPVNTALSQIKLKKVSTSTRPGTSQLPSLGHTTSRTPQMTERDSVHSSPTQKKYSRFRSEKRTTLLEVTPLDEETLSMMKRPKTKVAGRSNLSRQGNRTGN